MVSAAGADLASAAALTGPCAADGSIARRHPLGCSRRFHCADLHLQRGALRGHSRTDYGNLSIYDGTFQPHTSSPSTRLSKSWYSSTSPRSITTASTIQDALVVDIITPAAYEQAHRPPRWTSLLRGLSGGRRRILGQGREGPEREVGVVMGWPEGRGGGLSLW